jgi:hypothetical protein
MQFLNLAAEFPKGGDLGLDNVIVTGPTTSGIPEASTWAMLLVGFAGLGLERPAFGSTRILRS